jgi:hypothetical protein
MVPLPSAKAASPGKSPTRIASRPRCALVCACNAAVCNARDRFIAIANTLALKSHVPERVRRVKVQVSRKP